MLGKGAGACKVLEGEKKLYGGGHAEDRRHTEKGVSFSKQVIPTQRKSQGQLVGDRRSMWERVMFWKGGGVGRFGLFTFGIIFMNSKWVGLIEGGLFKLGVPEGIGGKRFCQSEKSYLELSNRQKGQSRAMKVLSDHRKKRGGIFLWEAWVQTF